MQLQIGDRAKYTLNDSVVEIISFQEKTYFQQQQVNCKCLESEIDEDVGQIFECSIGFLEKIETKQ